MGRNKDHDDDRLGQQPGALAPGLEQMAQEATDRSRARDGQGDRSLREADDRNHSESREEEDDERLEMFISTFLNNALPEMPEIPGYHLCWLSTTNTKDTIHMRLRIGYQLVKPEELRGEGWENVKLTSGEYAGCVGVNEMVLGKLSNRLYQRYMQAVHHDMPMDEAAKMRYKVERLDEQARSVKGRVTPEDPSAYASLDASAPVPDFVNPNWRPAGWYVEQMLRRGT